MMAQNETAAVPPLKERLFRACIAGCTCSTKTPDISFHDLLCHYRLFTEAAAEIGRLEAINAR
jgi:hypothetical protein